MRILIIDDSLVYRSQIKLVLGAESDFEVVKTAVHGQDGIDFLQQGGEVDLVVCDIEMPVLNGIDTVKKMRELGYRQPIIIFSAQNTSSAEMTIKALGAGADDFVIKPDGAAKSCEDAIARIKGQLVPRILQFFGKPQATRQVVPRDAKPRVVVPQASTATQKWSLFDPLHQRANLVVIASSTGGPPALENIIRHLKAPARIPICIVQHMPAVFTRSLAERLNQLTSLNVREAAQNEMLQPGVVYIAPGDFHMSLRKNMTGVVIHFDQAERRHSVRPCAEFLFESAAKIYGAKTFGIVLTGMGSDGRDGCCAIKQAGGCVVIQDETSSVVWGMPGAVHQQGAFDKQLPLDEIGPLLQQKITVLAAKPDKLAS